MMVYALINMINDKVYIGKTCRPLFVRINEHISRSLLVHDSRYDTPLYRSIRKYGLSNFILVVLGTVSSIQDLNLLESEMIKRHRSNNHKDGYNLTGGGDGIIGYRFSEESCKKRSERFKGSLNPMYGIKHTEEFKQYLSEINSGPNNKMFGVSRPDLVQNNLKRRKPKTPKPAEIDPMWRFHRTQSENTRAKIGDANRGRCRTDAHKLASTEAKRYLMKPIQGKHPDGTVINFVSVREAVRNGFDSGALMRCLKGKVKTHKKYSWKYIT